MAGPEQPERAEYLTCVMAGGVAEVYLSGETGPGVLLYMDAIGVRPQIASMADRIASWGYRVLAPHTFWRHGTIEELAPTTELRRAENHDSFLASGAMDRVRALTPDQVLEDADTWIDALRSAGAGGRLAVLGYCFGGRLALRTAAARPETFGLAALFHTGGLVTDRPDSPHLLVPHLRSFVLAGHADADPSNTADQVRALDAALTAADVPHRTAIYPGAPHGFTMADTSSYHEAGAERHYEELRDALDRFSEERA